MNIIDGQDFMEVLDQITAKNPDQLEEDEIAFMRARIYYLTPGQLDKFSRFLEAPSPEAPKARTEKKTKAKLN